MRAVCGVSVWYLNSSMRYDAKAVVRYKGLPTLWCVRKDEGCVSLTRTSTILSFSLPLFQKQFTFPNKKSI